MGKTKKKPKLPRGQWTRSPVQKAHSTKKGSKGYDRGASKKTLREEADGTQP